MKKYLVTVSSLALSIFGLASLSDAGPETLVANTAALAAQPGQARAFIARAGFATAGDGGAALYAWGASACSLNTGNGDNGFQVKPTHGTGCWNLQSVGQVDIRVWGAIGAADDTALITAADAAVGAGLVADISCPGTVNVKNAAFSNIKRIVGNGNCNFNLAAAGGTTDNVLKYIGTHPFALERVQITCPIYDLTTPASPAGLNGLLVQATGAAQNTGLKIKDVDVTGCSNGLNILQTQRVDIDGFFLDREYGHGIIISGASDTVATATKHIRIVNGRCQGQGQYCISAGINNQDVAKKAVSDLNIRNVHATGSGIIQNKFCYDITAATLVRVFIDVSGENCGTGGAEFKRTNGSHPLHVPNDMRDEYVKMTYYTNIDSGGAVEFPYEITTAAPAADQRRNLHADVYTTYNAPDAWQASTAYAVGDVVQNSGNAYIAFNAGTSAGSGGPTCGSDSCSIDGTIIWRFVEAVPATPVAFSGVVLEAITDAEIHLSQQGGAYGYHVFPRGSSDATIRRSDLYFDGTVDQSCLRDFPVPTGSGYIGASDSTVPSTTYEKVSLVNWRCRSNGGQNGALMFGPTSGTAASAWTGLEIIGGVFESTSKYAIYVNDSETSVQGAISGSPRFIGALGCFYLKSPWNVVWGGGGNCEVTGSGTNSNAITADGAGATGTFTISGEVAVKTAVAANAAGYRAWRLVNSSPMVINGRFVRGYASSIPTATACNYGDVFKSIQPGGAGQPGIEWDCTLTSSSAGTWASLGRALWAWASRPTCSTAGDQIIISDVGVSGRSDWTCDGTDWRPDYAILLGEFTTQSSAVTGTLLETLIDQVIVPGYTMGHNGGLRVTGSWSFDGTTNSRQPFVRFGGISGTGGTAYIAPPATTTAGNVAYEGCTTIKNRNSYTSQVGTHTNTGCGGGYGFGQVTGSADTTTTQYLSFNGKLGDIGDHIYVERAEVWLLP
jgi:hypothetical protein